MEAIVAHSATKVSPEYVRREYNRQITPRLARYGFDAAIHQELEARWGILYASGKKPEEIPPQYEVLFRALNSIWDTVHGEEARSYFEGAARAFISNSDINAVVFAAKAHKARKKAHVHR